MAALWLGLAASAAVPACFATPARGEAIAGFSAGGPGTGVAVATSPVAPLGGAPDQVCTIYPNDGVRAVVHAAVDFAPGKPTLLVVFALPNGNTIEQTVGCATAPGLDWHYDIQHVEAQVRLLRRQEARRNVVVAYVEADTLSWPAWRAKRPDAPRRIAGVVDRLVKLLPSTSSPAASAPSSAGGGEPVKVALACHSGGGAFLLSFLDSADAIPDAVERVVFLDANYSYDDPDKHHGDKLLRWLGGGPDRRLVVVAYDDREVTINGKKVVSDTGGTWRASMRMVERFGKDVRLTRVESGPGGQPGKGDGSPATPSRVGPGTRPAQSAAPNEATPRVPGTGATKNDGLRQADGRVVSPPNEPVAISDPVTGPTAANSRAAPNEPTVAGEPAVVLVTEPGQPLVRPVAKPDGPPVTWITGTVGTSGQVVFLLHRNPEVKILHTRLVELNGLIEAMTLGTANEANWGGTFFGPRAYVDLVPPLPAVPDRSPKAMPAVDVAATVKNLPTDKREQAIAAELPKGNFPPGWRRLVPVTLSAEVDGVRHECVVRVMPDVLAVGTDAEPLRVPLTPTTAMRVATQLGFTLPTRKIVDAVDAAATVRLEPRPLTEAREAFSTFVQHNAIVEEQRAAAGQAGRVGLLTGAKKDVVISNRLANPDPRPATGPTGSTGPASPVPRVAIYGWRKLDGKPIQPLTTVHKETYVDYSHGARLVSRVVTVDGQDRLIEDVLADPKLHVLLSDEGPLTSPAAFYRR